MSKFVLTAQLQLQAPNNVRQVVNQIQSQLNGINANINIQGTAQAQRQIQQITNATNQATGAANNLGQALGVSIKRYAGFTIASRAVSLFSSTLANAVKESIDFERELTKISQVTGKTIAELSDLTGEITRLSTQFGVAAGSLLNVSKILSQAGLDAVETKIALDALAKTALAPTFDDITQTAEGVVAIFNQFQQGASALESQLGSVNAVAGKFAVEAGDLISVVRRTGGVFKASGGDLNELIALFTSVRSTTRESAESIATGLRTIFTRIQRPATIQYLRQFGVELLDLEGKFVGPFEATKRLSEALGGLEQGDIKFVEIAEELGGFRQIGKVIPLLQQFTVAQEALKVAQEGSGSLAEDAAKAQLTLAVRIQQVQQDFLYLVRSITETTAFQVMASTVLSLAESLIKLGEALKPILPLLGALAAFKVARGFGSFVGGAKGALGFARGGIVPGSGNGDTVPAMLTPGEFVIRKSSVAKIGAGNLAAMNENRYAGGGLVVKNLNNEEFAGLFARPHGQDSSGKFITLAGDALQKGVETPGKEVLAITGAPKSYFIGNTDEDAFTNKAENLLKSGVKDLLLEIAGASVNDVNPAVISSVGFKDIAGKIFEAVTKEAIKDFRTGGERDSFDVPRFLEDSSQAGQSRRLLANLFNSGNPLPNIDFDNKLTENYSNRASLLKKAAAASLKAEGSNYFKKDSIIVPFASNKTTENIIKSRDKASAKIRFDELLVGLGNVRSKIKNPDIVQLVTKRITKQRQDLNKVISAGKAAGGLIEKFATGGAATGTDTVPALLTPGEFVVNKSSAQRIGYGNLNRMNKVGKYAKGGVVQHFEDGGRTWPGGAMSEQAAKTNSPKVSPETDKVKASAGQMAFALSVAASSLQAFTPQVDESSSQLTKLKNSVLQSITTITLFGSILGPMSSSMKGIIPGLDKFGASLNPFAAGILAVVGTTYLLDQAFTAMYDQTTKLNKAIADGNEAEAARLAGAQADFEGQRIGGNVGAGIGGLAGVGIGAKLGASAGAAAGTALIPVPVVGTAVGAIVGAIVGGITGAFAGFGLGTLLGDLFVDSKAKQNAIELARSHAIAAKASKDLTETQDRLNKALSEGRISQANEESAQAVKEFKQTIQPLVKERNKAMIESGIAGRKVTMAEGRSGTPIKDGGGDPSELPRARKEFTEASIRLNEKQQELNTKAPEFIKSQLPLLRENARVAGSRLAGGHLNPFDIYEEMFTGREDLKTVFESLPTEEADRLKNEFVNIAKAAALAKERFEALSLSLSPVNSTAGAAIVGLDNLSASLDPSNTQLSSSIRTLEASMTESAAGIKSDDFNSALDDVSEKLSKFGASDDTVNKFRDNTAAFASAQKDFASAFEATKVSIESQEGGVRKSVESGTISQELAKQIDKQLELKGFSQEQRNRVTTAVRGTELTDDQKNRLNDNDSSVFQEILSQAAKDSFDQAAEAAKKVAEAEQKLIPFLQKRIEAENKLVEAQQKAIDILGEARQAEESFGGPKVTLDERRNRVAARSNILGRSAGLSDMTADPASIRNRTNEIRASFEANQGRIQSGEQVTPEVQAQSDRLKKAQEEQVSSIRELIKIQQDEIKTIQEKQRLEKESIDSLMSGDIEKFFDQQAAQGAIAASASGNQSLMSAFGAQATGDAAKELRRMQEAGVGEVYGQQIGGAGGLLETTSLSAVQQRGLQGPAAMRAAQISAGTTDEQIASEKRGRELAKELAASGDLGADMAEMELKTAQIMVEKAELIINNAIEEQKKGAEKAGIAKNIAQGESEIKRSEQEIKKQQDIANKAKDDMYFNRTERDRIDNEMQNISQDQNMSDQEKIKRNKELWERRTATYTNYDEAKNALPEANKNIQAEEQRIQQTESAIEQNKEKFKEGSSIQGPSSMQNLRQNQLNQTSASIDPKMVENLASVADQFTNFSASLQQSASSLQGLEIAHQLGDIGLNINGLNFLKDIDPVIANKVVDAIQKEIGNYRPTADGMAHNKGKVLPTA